MTIDKILESLQKVSNLNVELWEFWWIYNIYEKVLIKEPIYRDWNKHPTKLYTNYDNEEECYKPNSTINRSKTLKSIYNFLNNSEKFLRFDIGNCTYFFSDDYAAVEDEYGSLYSYTKCGEIPEELESLFEFIAKKKTVKFVYKSSRGLQTEAIEININETDLNLNYNDDLPDDRIHEILSTKNESSLIILSGLPGTGKTTYLRHLISTLPDCDFNVIGIDDFSAMLQDKTSFLTFKNSVLIIEDCELLVKSRNASGAITELAGLLNLADGLYGDIMKAKIICTFNTNISNVDQALLRKGRLSLRYDFKELSKEKKEILCKKLGTTCESGLLCDIYNEKPNTLENQTKQRRIGF